MELNSNIDQEQFNRIVEFLLKENGRLRLELAQLLAITGLHESSDSSDSFPSDDAFNESVELAKNMPPELVEMLSKLDIK